MRTNIVIDDELLNEVIRLTGAKTKKDAVEMGLRTLVRVKKQEKIKAYKGKLVWDGDLDSMRTD
jgi:Arc/MetJ family transcription regulator